MNQYKFLFIGTYYAVLAPGRKNKNHLEGTIFFTDGSWANLDNGQMLDLGEEDEPRMTIVPLISGLNYFNLGILNNSSKLRSWRGSQIQINYPGPVNIIPSLIDTISVDENKYCSAYLNDEGVVVITSTGMDEVSYLHDNQNPTSPTNTPHFNYKTKHFPALNIWAPVNTTIKGKAAGLNFSQLKHVDMEASFIHGQLITETITANGPDLLSLNLSTAPTIEIARVGDVNILSVGKVDHIKVQSGGDVRIICNEAGTVHVNAGGEFRLTAKNVDKISSASEDDSVIEIADESHTIEAETGGSLIIKGGKLHEIAILEATGDITIDVQLFDVLYAKGHGSLSITTYQGTQNIHAESDGPVKISLATANEVVIKAKEISLMAHEYLQPPKVPIENPNNFISIRT